MKWPALAIVLLVSGSAGAQDSPLTWQICGKDGCSAASGTTTNIGIPVHPWRLITQTYAGRIDIRKGLTQEQCEHDRLKALNQPADGEEKTHAAYFAEKDSSMSVDQYAYTRISSDIRHAICEKQP